MYLFVRCRQLWLLVLITLIWYCRTERMKRMFIPRDIYPDAVCNDGSRGVYYISRTNNNSNWLIFMESGGVCANKYKCNERFANSPYLMSSDNYPESVETRTLLSLDIYKYYNKVVMVYCSSDLWLGNGTFSNDGEHPRYLYFRGTVIFDAIIKELLKSGLRNSMNILLAGSSGGGVGALNHAVKLESMLLSRVSVILDSAWFINFNNFLTAQSKEQAFGRDIGAWKRTFCKDTSWGYPCCYSASCLLNKNYIPNTIKILVVQSRYDIYMLYGGYPSGSVNGNEMQDINTFKPNHITSYVHSLGAQMLQSVDMVKQRDNLSIFLTSCFQHVHLMSTNLWEKVYKGRAKIDKSVDPDDDIIKITHSVTSSLWNTITMDGSNINETIKSWHNVTYKQKIQNIDICTHAQCNPTCPQLVYFDGHKTEWAKWQAVVIICVIMFITACILLVKLVWIIQHCNLRNAQAVYLSTNKGDYCTKTKCIPICPPHSSIGISCSALEFDLPSHPVVDQTKTSASSLRPFRKKTTYVPGKKIIKGVTAYFNPGQLVAIMGPSGAGKTTLLDVLMSRKKKMREAQANIYINGLPADEVRNWFITNSGYVLQLAVPYHEELTVRQNITYSALMRLPMRMSLEEKMGRVEQVLGQCGLVDLADVVVGNSVIGGISGGQKRRLCIAMQLLDLPSVIFLDEPTSGLDASSSLELLETLHGLTLSGRLVVVTIHQPRIEIFHMFDTILLLCDGNVAYFGSPIMAPTLIAESLQGSEKVLDASNPADYIMDVLTNNSSQTFIVDFYAQSGEIESIDQAIHRARRHPQKTLSMKFQKQTSSIQNRLLALDGRSSVSQTLSQKLYFPLVFFIYGLSLGTCYWKTESGILLMSCYMVFSCASQLFMASVIHGHLRKAFSLFTLERADGIGHSHELVVHVFIRTFSQSSLPLFLSCGIIYLCTSQDYDWSKFWLTSLIHLQLNQTWIAVIVFVACVTPQYSHLVSPLLSAIAGFAGGFLVPAPQMPAVYYWLFYINPTHWAYGGMMKALVHDMKFNCRLKGPMECKESAGMMILKKFGLHKKSPYDSMVILLLMTCLCLLSSVATLELKNANIKFMDTVRNWITIVWLALKNCVKFIHAFICVQLKKNGCEYMPNVVVSEQPVTEVEKNNITASKELCNDDVHVSVSCEPECPVYDVNERQAEDIEDSENSSRANDEDSSNDGDYSCNDEDDCDNTALQAKGKTGSRKSSIASLLTKIHASLQRSRTSSISIPSNSNNPNTDPVPKLRMKDLKRKKFSNRRKTFTDFIDDRREKGTNNLRPLSLMLPSKNSLGSKSYSRTLLSHTPSKHSTLSGISNIARDDDRNSQLEEECNNKTTTFIEDTHIPLRQSDQSFNPDVTQLAGHSLGHNDTVIDVNENFLISHIESDVNASRINGAPTAITPIPIQGSMNTSPINGTSQSTTRAPPSENCVHKEERNISKRSISPKENTKDNTLRREEKRKTSKKRSEVRGKDTWSKYLDVVPKRHEVFCSLNRFKEDAKVILRRHDCARAQRSVSSTILEEKRTTMRTQINGLRQSFMEGSTDTYMAYSPTSPSPSRRRKISVPSRKLHETHIARARPLSSPSRRSKEEEREGYVSHVNPISPSQDEAFFNPFHYNTSIVATSYSNTKQSRTASVSTKVNVYNKASDVDAGVGVGVGRQYQYHNADDQQYNDENTGEESDTQRQNSMLDNLIEPGGKDTLLFQEPGYSQHLLKMREIPEQLYENEVGYYGDGLYEDKVELIQNKGELYEDEDELYENNVQLYDGDFEEREGEREEQLFSTEMKIVSRKSSQQSNSKACDNEQVHKSVAGVRASVNCETLIDEVGEDYFTVDKFSRCNIEIDYTSEKSNQPEPIIKQLKQDIPSQRENDIMITEKMDLNNATAEKSRFQRRRLVIPLDLSPPQQPKVSLRRTRQSPSMHRKLFIPLVSSTSQPVQANFHMTRLPIQQGSVFPIHEGINESDGDVFKDKNKPADKNRANKMPGDISCDISSTSSDDNDLLKTEEGFIIPEDTVTRIIGNESRCLQLQKERVSKQEDMERLFKKENFLENIPMGMVSQLKSRFESKPGCYKMDDVDRRRSLDVATIKNSKSYRKKMARVLSLRDSSNMCVSASESDHRSDETTFRRIIKRRRNMSLESTSDNVTSRKYIQSV